MMLSKLKHRQTSHAHQANVVWETPNFNHRQNQNQNHRTDGGQTWQTALNVAGICTNGMFGFDHLHR